MGGRGQGAPVLCARRHYGSDAEPAPLELSCDGVLVTHLDGRAAIYYLDAGAWRRFIVAK